MKISVFFALILTLSTAHAYTFKEENKPISSKKILEDALRMGLNPSADEIEARNEIRSWSDRTKKQHLESGAPDPLLAEVKKQNVNLEKAKVIARQQVYRAVEKNWNKIKNTSLNEYAVDSFDHFAPYLKRELSKIEYIETNDPKRYLFSLSWADIKVDHKLKKVSWVIRIGSHLDGNRLQEGAEKIVVPERSAE